MIKNTKANEMRRLCSECKRDNNLGLAHENFNLMEKMKEMHECCPEWAEYEWKKHNDKLTTIFLPEFMNRHLFVSSYAWLMNSFFGIKGVKCHHGTCAPKGVNRLRWRVDAEMLCEFVCTE